MTNTKKKKPVKKTLHGTPSSSASKNTIGSSLQKGGLVLLSAVTAGAVGAVIGKHSLLAGIPVTLLGIYKNNPYITAAGLGITLSSAVPKASASQSVNGTEEDMHGFDMDQIKERVGTYFKNFSHKLYMPVKETQADDTAVNGADQPTYFLNDYNTPSLEGDIDLSELNKVQAQIAQMNGMEDPNKEF